MHSEKQQVIRSAGLVSVLTMASRVLGLLRDATIARFLGHGAFSDIFFIAFEIPNLLRRVLGEGSLSAIIIPIFAGERKRGGERSAFRFAANAINIIGLFTLGFTILGIVFARYFFMVFGGIELFVHGEAELLNLGSLLTRIMFPIMITLSLSSILMGMLHSYQHFSTPALGPILMNVSMIGGIVAFGGLEGRSLVVVLAGAALFGTVLRVLIMLPPLFRRGFRYSFSINFHDENFRMLVLLLLPAFAGLVISQLNISVDKILARFLARSLSEGPVTYLTYSHRLIQFPLAIFATAMATALMPAITRSFLDKDIKQTKELMGFAFRVVFFIMMPATVGLIVVGHPIVELIFQGRNFDASGVTSTAFALMFYGVGLIPLALHRLLIPVFYARKDTMTPVKFAAVAMIVNIVLNLILMRTRLRFGGLALATSIAAGVNVWLLLMRLRKEIGAVFEAETIRSFVKTLLASIAMGAACAWTMRWLRMRLLPGAEAGYPVVMMWRAITTFATIGIGAGVFLVISKLLGGSEIGEVLRLIRGRSRAK